MPSAPTMRSPFDGMVEGPVWVIVPASASTPVTRVERCKMQGGCGEVSGESARCLSSLCRSTRWDRYHGYIHSEMMSVNDRFHTPDCSNCTEEGLLTDPCVFFASVLSVVKTVFPLLSSITDYNFLISALIHQ